MLLQLSLSSFRCHQLTRELALSPGSPCLLRVVEGVSLLLNLLAFYLIVIANKKLFKDPAKGGYGTHILKSTLKH